MLPAFLYSIIEDSTVHQTNYCSRLQTIRRSDYKPMGLLSRLKELRTFSCFPLSQHRGFYFPPPANGWRSPFLSRTGNVLHAFLNQLSHACPLQEENIPLHTVPNSIGICRQQTKFATFTLSLQRGKRVAVFPLV